MIEVVALVIVGILGSCLFKARSDAARLKVILQRVLSELEVQRKTERERIARELHDGLGQLLIATRHSLELAHERRAVRAEADAFLERGLAQLADAISETRCIAHDMKSVLLQKSEFSEALSLLCHEFGEGANIRTECRIADDLIERALPPAATSALIRIAQEALSNVGKHAAASCVRVLVDADVDHVEMRVIDDGRGLRAVMAREANGLRGIGLHNMRERAAALGGTLRARDLGGGTEIHARLPLAPQSISKLQRLCPQE